MYNDETRLSGTYGSDYDFDYQYDEYDTPPDAEDIDYDFENDEPLLWQDEIEDVTEDFPF